MISKQELDNFEDFLCKRNDVIDNAVYDTCVSLLEKAPEQLESEFPWNMEIIGNIAEDISETLKVHGHPLCWPYYEESSENGLRIPCYMSESCDVPKSECKFRKQYLIEKGDKRQCQIK